MKVKTRTGTNRERARALALTAAITALPCAGCLNPNAYTTPRTTPPGEVQHSLSLDYVSVRAAEPSLDSDDTPYSPYDSRVTADNTLTMPSYGFRVGITDRLDFGARLPSMAAIELDLKWNFWKTRFMDAAVVPGVAGFYLEDEGHVLVTAPLMLGINPAPSFSIVPLLGLAYSSGSEPGYGHDRSDLARVAAAYVHAGLGLDFRVSPAVAMQPQMSLLRSLSTPDDSTITWYAFGVGFNWGALPAYESSDRPPGAVN